MAVKLKLKNVRLSFPDLFEAKQFQGEGAYRYGATFLIPKNSPQIKEINAAIQKAAEEKWPKKGAAKVKSFEGNANKFAFMDGDVIEAAKGYDGYAGNMSLSAKRRQEDGRPLIIDANKAALTEKDGKPYAGCYVNATVEIWAQDGKFPGMRCALLAVQFHKDGDSFASGSKGSEDDFDDLSEGAEATEEASSDEDDLA